MDRILSFFKKYKNVILYSASLFLLLILLFIVFSKPNSRSFFSAMEAKTFDLRQIVISDAKKTHKDIVIVTVDDPSYEYLLNRYGDWPVPREVYADFINYVEAEKPSVIAFDLLFVNSLRSKPDSDRKLVEAISKYDNVFTAISFDDQPSVLRKPAILPQYLRADMQIKSKHFEPALFTNCRSILKAIIDSTPNIGHINTPKSEDGINRTAPLFIRYPEYNPESLNNNKPEYNTISYYPYMTLKIALKYLKEKENFNLNNFIVDKNNNLVLGSRKIPMTNDGEVILNWYGETGLKNNKTFTYIPFWKIIKSIDARKNNEPELLPKDLFKGKVVYLGTSIFSLSDIKSVPTEKYLPGVELHATLLNNIIDNNIIKKPNTLINIVITLIFAAIVGLIVFFTSSTFISSVAALLLILSYLFLSTYVMQFFNLWVWVVMPVLAAVLAFIIAYLVKYILKSRDFEYTYKLATTDGLTELYNHRFFQEQMLFNIEYSKRAENNFSLILIDIDFFKKFNDKFGHQAGDAVLKQVAQTLKKTVRSSDLVCRYGGEEMSIILRDTTKEEALIAAQKICDMVAKKPYKLGPDLESNVTISLGVSTFPVDGETPSELIARADKGLYAAKENGRNQVGKID